MQNRRTFECWKCHLQRPVVPEPLAGEESFCDHCLVWLFPEGLVKHGPISNSLALMARRGGKRAPSLSAYPHNFRTAYAASQRQYDSEMQLTLPLSDPGKKAADALYRFFTRD